MNQQHHRHGLFRHAIAICVAARRKRQIGWQRQSVAALDLDRLHWLQRRAYKFGTGGVERRERPGITVIDESLRRCGQRVVPHDPCAVILGAAGNAVIAFQLGAEPFERGFEPFVQRYPLILQVVDRIGLNHTGFGVADCAAKVGLAVFRDQRLLAGLGVLRIERGGVATTAVEPIEDRAVGGVTRWRGRQRIFHRG